MPCNTIITFNAIPMCDVHVIQLPMCDVCLTEFLNDMYIHVQCIKDYNFIILIFTMQ